MNLKIWKCSQSDSLFTKEEQNDLLKRKVVCVYPDTSAKGTSSVKQGENFRNISKGDLFYLCYGNNGIILLGMFIGEKQYSQLQGKKDWLEQKYIPLFESRYKNKKYEGEKRWWTPNDNSTFVQIQNNKEFENWILHPFFSKTLDNIENELNNITKMINTQEYINLLHSTHNLILTGAPGTGKTYLAKQIAETMGCTENEIEFVQFHPSYDYTDFVEGLRPIQDDNGNVGFERKDGVFKAFCKKAVSFPKNDTIDNFNETWDKLVDTLNENNYIDVPFLSNKSKSFRVELNEYGTGLANRTYPNDTYEQGGWISGQSKFFSKDQLYNIYRGLSGVPSGGHDNYRRAIVEEMKKSLGLKPYKEGSSETKSDKDFVFIIDEINRGEISKIFGELFFSIDPGYRGKDGVVQTQYQNIVKDDDVFKKGFYVPKNVYIIGTMNDIDRSVESMDFAMRRRFAWKEVTATDSQEMLDSEDAWGKDKAGNSLKPDDKIIQKEDGGNGKNSIKDRMDNLNKKIWHKPTKEEKDENKSIEGLSSAYHIGASYFLKLANYKKDDGTYDFDKLWEYHLEGLLFEYLRGTTDIYKKIKELAQAYGYTKANKYE